MFQLAQGLLKLFYSLFSEVLKLSFIAVACTLVVSSFSFSAMAVDFVPDTDQEDERSSVDDPLDGPKYNATTGPDKISGDFFSIYECKTDMGATPGNSPQCDFYANVGFQDSGWRNDCTNIHRDATWKNRVVSCIKDADMAYVICNQGTFSGASDVSSKCQRYVTFANIYESIEKTCTPYEYHAMSTVSGGHAQAIRTAKASSYNLSRCQSTISSALDNKKCRDITATSSDEDKKACEEVLGGNSGCKEQGCDTFISAEADGEEDDDTTPGGGPDGDDDFADSGDGEEDPQTNDDPGIDGLTGLANNLASNMFPSMGGGSLDSGSTGADLGDVDITSARAANMQAASVSRASLDGAQPAQSLAFATTLQPDMVPNPGGESKNGGGGGGAGPRGGGGGGAFNAAAGGGGDKRGSGGKRRRRGSRALPYKKYRGDGLSYHGASGGGGTPAIAEEESGKKKRRKKSKRGAVVASLQGKLNTAKINAAFQGGIQKAGAYRAQSTGFRISENERCKSAQYIFLCEGVKSAVRQFTTEALNAKGHD